MTTPSSPTPPPTPEETPVDAPPPTSGGDTWRDLGQRAESLGREAEEAANRWGREAEDVTIRLGSSRAVRDTADAATRVWGLVLLGVGIWFFADLTLGYEMPRVAWRELWPLLLIVLGLIVVVRGMRRT